MCKGEAIAVFLKFNSKESRRGSEVFEAVVLFERGNEGMNLRGRWSKDEDIINIDEKVKRARGGVVERCISFGAVKSKFKELPSEFVIPFSGGLFETIQGLPKLAHMMRMLRMMKAGRLIHINKLMEIIVEKCIGNVQLLDMPLFANRKC